jgi:2-oxoisovalerate dehydrogenase E1 component alpha subunit
MPTILYSEIYVSLVVAKVVANFEINYTQILDATAKICAQLPEFTNDHAYLIALYRTMVLTRIFDQKAIALQRIGKLGTYPPSYGQEAISAVIGHAMHTDDIFLPYYRDHAAQIQRHVKMSEILAYWGGDERGSDFAQSNDFPICVPIASQCLHAAGVAFAFKYKQENKVAVVSIGDGGTSEGDFYEALNVAGVWNLPVVFVINNNQWAISVNIKQQTATQTLAQKAIAAGIEGVQVDGNDVLAMHQVFANALHKARTGNGATVIEALTYRLSDHTTADDATRYQPKHEVNHAQQIEPIARFKHFLQQHIDWNDEQEANLIKSCEDEVQQEVNKYLHMQPQAITSAFDYHFSYLPDYLIEQRATAIEEATHG